MIRRGNVHPGGARADRIGAVQFPDQALRVLRARVGFVPLSGFPVMAHQLAADHQLPPQIGGGNSLVHPVKQMTLGTGKVVPGPCLLYPVVRKTNCGRIIVPAVQFIQFFNYSAYRYGLCPRIILPL